MPPTVSARPQSATSTPHLHGLDGLRGIVAIAVLTYHYHKGWMPNGPLGVDIFFVLSGFVIGYSYDAKLAAGMSARAFAARRFVRLFPMIALAALLAALCRGLTDQLGYSVPLGWPSLVGLATLSALLIPAIAQRDGLAEIFPLNPPVWSLFFEAAINIGYGLFRRFLTRTVLFAIIVLSGAIIAWKGFGGNHVHNIQLGFVRVAFGFGVGLLLHRLWQWDRAPRLRIGFVPASVIVLGVLALPIDLSGMRGVAAVLLLAAIVYCTANATERQTSARLCAGLGALSYPLYLLHAPILEIIKYISGATMVTIPVMVLCYAALLGLAMLAARFYETPMRRWLGAALRLY